MTVNWVERADDTIGHVASTTVISLRKCWIKNKIKKGHLNERDFLLEKRQSTGNNRLFTDLDL